MQFCSKINRVLLLLQDYLAAPMPFLVGLHAPNLFASALRSSALEEVVLVDLDRGTVRVCSRAPIVRPLTMECKAVLCSAVCA